MINQSGKAILVVERDGCDSGSDGLDVTIYCLTGISKDDHNGQDWLYQSANELAAYHDWLPAQCYRMKHGDKCVFKVNFSQSYYFGDRYTTDDDEEIEFYNIRKLRHTRGENISRRALKKFYRSKSHLTFGGKIKPSKKQIKRMELNYDF